MFAEIALSLLPLSLLIYLQQKPEMFLFWLAAVFLAYAYSAPPLRLKSRGILAVLSLLIVLSILPITFVTYVFTTSLTLPFWLFLIGQALTVYGIIIPAEIRDYFVDKKMGITTNTVRLGLIKASVFGIVLLVMGGILAATGLTMYFAQTSYPWLTIFLIILGVAYVHILRKYWKLYTLSKQRVTVAVDKQQPLEEEIVKIAADNPKWITPITQVIMIMCIIILASKFI
jgi:4-hydroxybenzoate polyprenyltransferase